jgi:hypothetical protein
VNQVDLRIADASVETLLRVIEAIASHPHTEQSAIARFAGIGGSTGTRALGALQALGLAERDEAGRYLSRAAEARRGLGEVDGRELLRQALIVYRPFELLCEGLALGEHRNDAVRKATVLLGIDDREWSKYPLLEKWGVELGLLEVDAVKGLRLAAAVLPSASPGPILRAADTESVMKARLWIAARIGRDAFNFIEEQDRTLLATAVHTIQTDPPDSVEKSGQALENFLREVASSRGLAVEAAKMNGAGQLASFLISKGLIHSHQQKLVDAVSSLRNAKAHHKDKKTLAPWKITDHGALAAVITSLTAIHSIYQSLENGNQIL